MRFHLILASREEWNPCRRRLGEVRRLHRKKLCWLVQGAGYEGYAVLSGMGATQVAARLATLASLPPPQWLISAGFGGALQTVPPPGVVQVVNAVWHYDPISAGLRPVTNLLPLPAALIRKLQELNLPISYGPVVSTPEILPKKKLRLICQALPAPVVDLESATLAAYAQKQGVGFLGLRAITDGGEEEIAPFLADLIASHGGVPWGPLAMAVLQDWRRIKYLRHLHHRARQAGEFLAETLRVVVTFLARAGANQT